MLLVYRKSIFKEKIILDKSNSFKYEELLTICCKLLQYKGLTKAHSQTTAEAICSASLRGVDSHGIRLLPHYLEAIKAGRIVAEADFQFQQTANSSGILNANHGMAHAAVTKAMEHAIELAMRNGAGFVSVKNSNHCGALACYALKACEHDMIGMVMTNATPKLQVYNAAKPYFGINPICIAAPMEGEEPFCYDAAPSAMSNNKIKMIGEYGELLPEGVAADKNGEMTIEPGLARMLLPLGGELAGYKGYAMAMIVDIFCSLLSGMPGGEEVSAMYEKDGAKNSDKRYLSQFVGAFRIDSFEDVNVFKKRLKQTADKVRAMPRSVNSKDEVMVPGDPEKKMKAERLINGIPIEARLYIELKGIADEYDVEI